MRTTTLRTTVIRRSLQILAVAAMLKTIAGLARFDTTNAQLVSRYRCLDQPVTILGTPGYDVLYGTNGPDVIHGLGGGDTIYGFDGNDIICGSAGDNQIIG